MQRLDENGIQTRPVWTLNHLQKLYQECQNYKIERAKEKLSIRLNKTKEDIKLVKERKPRYTFKYEKLEE